MSVILYTLITLTGVAALCLLTKAVISGIQFNRYRRRNREAQFSGSAATTFRRKTREERMGERGEYIVSSYLASLPREEYQVFNDILIRNGKYTTQVDHIVLSRYGVFVLETKNLHGRIYGSERSEFWKQYLPAPGFRRFGFTEEHEFRNPIWQNESHIKTLRRHVFGDGLPVHGIVAFPDETEIKVSTDKPVIAMWDIVPYIAEKTDVVLSDDQLSRFKERILDIISTDGTDRERHLGNVYANMNHRDEMVARGKCPRCGGDLVEIERKRHKKVYACSRCSCLLNN